MQQASTVHEAVAVRRERQKQWRIKDLEQRSLDNARVLWDRFVERNRRDVEERAEQLKSIGNISALVSGFAVVAFLEFQVNWKKINVAVEVLFGLTTALVVGRCLAAGGLCELSASADA
jgi:calcium release-activated calcium channel protein 1